MKRQAKPNKRLPEWEEICAVACAVQNMHLMATSMNHIGAFCLAILGANQQEIQWKLER